MAAKFVFISGGITKQEVRDFLARLPNERLDKPFDSKRLRAVARKYAARGEGAAQAV
jgi:hypothetical protein